MRILLSGVSPWVKSGYGTQGAYLAKAFRELGHEVFMMPHWGMQGGPLAHGGVEFLPLHRDGWGRDIIGQHVKAARIDAVLSFHDVWVLGQDWPKSFNVPWITYSPVDSVPLPPRLAKLLQEAKYVVAMSRFGQEEMRKAGIASEYVPHAIDTDVFRPGDKAEARRELGLNPDRFICLIAAANHFYPSRKAFPEQMAAFAEFHREFSDTELALHTALVPTTNAGGVDINDLVRDLGLGDCTCNTEEYDIAMGLSDERMALMYRAADVLLGASYAEGYGLCQAESQACGTPVIVHDFAASPEFLFAGIKVPSAQRFWNLIGAWQAVPSIAHIVRALRETYLNRGRYAEQGLQAAEMVREGFSHSVVRDVYWKPFLEGVAADIGRKKWPFKEVAGQGVGA